MTFVESLSPAAREALIVAGQPIEAGAGEVVIREGDPADRILLMTAGVVKVTKLARNGSEVVLDFRGPGEILGEQAMLGSTTRTASVTAIGAVTALAVAAPDFRAWLAVTPDAAVLLLGTLARRLREADRQRLEFGAAQTLARVAARLLDLTERFGLPSEEGAVIEIGIAQEELAAWSGASREATVKALRSLRALGLVETHRRRLIVRDPEGLARHAA